MLDLAFIAFIGFILLLGLRRPFLWVLLYVYIDILAPQRIGYSIITELQVSLIAFAAAFGGWLFLDRKEGARFTLRQGLMLALLIYCWWTLQNAQFPESAVTKWDWVWKALLFAIFLPLTITTRARIEALALTLTLSVATIVIGTGMKTVLGGGGYGNLKFFVQDNSGIYESSTLATVAIALIPLVVWFTRFGTIYRPHWTIDYASRNPFGGGFDSYKANSFTYTLPVKTETENTVTVQYREVTDEGRAFHSSIFELLGEQGYPGLAIWLLLHGLGIWQMEKLYRRWKGADDESEAWISPLAAALQMASMVYLVGATFQGIAYQPVMLMIIGLQTGLYSYVTRLDSARGPQPGDITLSPTEKRRLALAQRAAKKGEAPGAVTA